MCVSRDCMKTIYCFIIKITGKRRDGFDGYGSPWSLKRMPVLADYHVIDFRQIHWLGGKISLTCCWEEKLAFLSVGSVNVVVLLPLMRDRQRFWSKCLEICVVYPIVYSIPELSDKHSGSIRLNYRDRRCDRCLREEYMLKRWVMFTFYG